MPRFLFDLVALLSTTLPRLRHASPERQLQGGAR